jgi:hypothetical protein
MLLAHTGQSRGSLLCRSRSRRHVVIVVVADLSVCLLLLTVCRFHRIWEAGRDLLRRKILARWDFRQVSLNTLSVLHNAKSRNQRGSK